MRQFSERIVDAGIAETKNVRVVEKRAKHEPLTMVPFADVERILAVIREKTGDNNSQISIACGYNSSMIRQWKSKGEIPVRGKLSILGFAFELEIQSELKASPPPVVESMFDRDELTVLFAVLLGTTEVAQIAVHHGTRNKVFSKIAAALSKGE